MNDMPVEVKEEQSIIEGEQRQEEQKVLLTVTDSTQYESMPTPVEKKAGKCVYLGINDEIMRVLPSEAKYIKAKTGWRRVK